MGSTSSSPNQTELEEPTFTKGHEDLVKPLYDNGRYQNPFDTHEERGFMDLLGLMKEVATNDKSDIPWNDKTVSCVVVF